MHMMLQFDGSIQRSVQQWEKLFKRTGWKFNRIVVGEGYLSVVEAIIE